MAHDRQIFFSAECDAAAALLGGYARIDGSLTVAIYDALRRNPYGFKEVNSDWYSARYIVTKPFRDMPALSWWFRINDGDVTIEHVEEFEDY